MCRPVKCRQCSKTTWAGCGMHVDEVMAGVPSAQRCDCSADGSVDDQGGFLARLFGR